MYDLEAPLPSASSQLQLEQSLEQSLEQFEMTRDDAVDLIDGDILNMLGLDPSASHLPEELPYCPRASVCVPGELVASLGRQL